MTEARKAALFLGLAFGVGWTALIAAYLQGARSLSEAAAAGTINVFSPTLAAVTCSLAFEKGRRIEALGLNFRPNRWWLWAALIAAGMSVAATLAANPAALVTPIDEEAIARRLASALGRPSGEAGGYLWLSAALLPPALIGFALFFTFSEELGWRGYAYDRWRRFGFWRYSLGLGAIWGIWHWPVIYLFGLNYPDHRVLGLAVFPLFCALYSVPMTLVRDRGRSTLAPGIFHGVWNCLALIAPLVFVAPESPWADYWSSSAMGLGGCLAVAAGALLIAAFRPSAAAGEEVTAP